jgi:serralysin
MCNICAGTATFDPGRHPGGATFATIFEGVDAPADTSTPYSISVGDVFSGDLGFAGDRDWVAVTLEAGETYTISVSGSPSGSGTLTDAYLRFYDSDGNLIALNDDGGTGTDSELTYTATTSGTYYISAGGFSDFRAGTYEVTVEVDTPPEPASLNELADYLVSGYWQDSGRSARSFDTSGSNQITYDISGLTAEGQQLALWAMEAWELMADIEFVEVGSGADITFDDEASGAYAQTFTSGGNITSVNVNVSTNWLSSYGTTIDSYSFQTYVHEIGHALGLGHQGGYNGAATYGQDETFSNDSWQISIMSYFSQSQNTTTDASYALLLTPMMADIIAIQSMYGASDATRGRTVWGEGSNLGGYIGEVFAEIAGEGDSSNYNGSDMAFTIHDAGGRDLIDFSYATQGMRVDLRPGTFSDVGGLTGNMAIARGTIIEELFTGSGADDVTGNNADNLIRTFAGDDMLFGGGGRDILRGDAGNDMLFGRNGHDKLFGGAGADELYGGKGRDILRGGGGNDTLEGGNHNDKLFGGGGRDILRGDAGNDMLFGRNGHDKLFGGAGSDELYGGKGRDVLRGGGGNDTLEGGNHNDKLFGGGGRDILRGGAGNDTLFGGNGHDRLIGGSGNDAARGGNGADTFVFSDGHDEFTIRDFSFSDNDRLELDDDLWNGSLTARQVVNTYGTVVNGDMVLDFGDGDVIVLEGITSSRQLANYIDIV